MGDVIVDGELIARLIRRAKQRINNNQIEAGLGFLDNIGKVVANGQPMHVKQVPSAAGRVPAPPKKRGKRTPTCRNGHEYTEANTYVTPQGARRCRTCRNARQARFEQKRRQRGDGTEPMTRKQFVQAVKDAAETDAMLARMREHKAQALRDQRVLDEMEKTEVMLADIRKNRPQAKEQEA